MEFIFYLFIYLLIYLSRYFPIQKYFIYIHNSKFSNVSLKANIDRSFWGAFCALCLCFKTYLNDSKATFS